MAFLQPAMPTELPTIPVVMPVDAAPAHMPEFPSWRPLQAQKLPGHLYQAIRAVSNLQIRSVTGRKESCWLCHPSQDQRLTDLTRHAGFDEGLLWLSHSAYCQYCL